MCTAIDVQGSDSCKHANACCAAQLHIAHWLVHADGPGCFCRSTIPTFDGAPTCCVGVVISMGCEGGLALTAAHELIHSKRWADRFMGDALLATFFYMHWAHSHLAHHIKVLK
jgi:fatty acid desaturase